MGRRFYVGNGYDMNVGIFQQHLVIFYQVTTREEEFFLAVILYFHRVSGNAKNVAVSFHVALKDQRSRRGTVQALVFLTGSVCFIIKQFQTSSLTANLAFFILHTNASVNFICILSSATPWRRHRLKVYILFLWPLCLALLRVVQYGNLEPLNNKHFYLRACFGHSLHYLYFQEMQSWLNLVYFLSPYILCPWVWSGRRKWGWPALLSAIDSVFLGTMTESTIKKSTSNCRYMKKPIGKNQWILTMFEIVQRCV